VIDGSKSNGITLDDNSVSRGQTVYLSEFTGNTIKNSAKAPIYTDAYCGIYPLRNLGAGNTFSGNANEYISVNVFNTEIHSDMTLPNVGEPYYMVQGLTVTSGRKLTIEAGITILMGARTYIRAYADSWFVAEGTAAAHITIKGFDEKVGYWHGIQINSQTPGSKLNYCDISGAGGGTEYYKALLYMYTGSFANDGSGTYTNAYIELNNTTFNKSLYYGIYFDKYHGIYNKCIVSGGANVTFNQCAVGNVYVAKVGNKNDVVYATLAEAMAAQ
jgi:hypothetical protein